MRGTGNLRVTKTGEGTLLNPTDTFKNLFRDYFSAVSYMHEKNFIHGSIDIDRLFTVEGKGKISSLEKAVSTEDLRKADKRKRIKLDLLSLARVMGRTLTGKKITINRLTYAYEDLSGLT
ncbi:hypothetical protein CASFOL_039790 [Castilleja foliolosa]|uniref:Protein kinase domain-containing protein n=1 Tax=Castilleja foliolosa TaxID=1961234 RepID=A0ABD3BG74_9LAMI